MLNILWRSIKWRIKNPLAIIIPVLQPLIWLVLYSTIGTQSLKNSGIGNYTAFILPGLIVLVIFGACSSSGMMNLVMKSNGSFFRILISPVSRNSILLGQILEGVIISFVEVIILLIVSIFFSVKIASTIGGILLIILLVFLTSFFMSSLAYCISLILPNQVIYETLMTAIVLPIFFLSSALFPIDNLSQGLKIAVTINPFTHIINVIRSLMLHNTIMFNELFFVIGLFIIMCIISFLLAKRKLIKEIAH